MTVRWNWGLGMALVYAVFATGTVSVVILASATRVDLVSDDYYERALTFDRHLEAADRGQASGVTLNLESPSNVSQLVVCFPEVTTPHGDGSLMLYRASAAGSDRTFPLRVDSNGRGTVSLADLPSGRWIAQLSWTAHGQDYYVEKAITIP
jgi:hypothetical protein